MITAGHTGTRVRRLGFHTSTVLWCLAMATDADWTLGTNYTMTIGTTINIDALITRLIAIPAGDKKHCYQW